MGFITTPVGYAVAQNWVYLAGAKTQLGVKAQVLDYTESYIFNSSKRTMIGRAAAIEAGAAGGVEGLWPNSASV